MDKVEKLLSEGDLRTAGHSEKVVKMVLSKPELFDNVIRAMLSHHPGTRMRASDAAEKITRDYPEWLQPHKNLFLGKISEITQKEVRWHIAQILPRLKLTKKERDKVYNLMLEFLNDDSRIVKTFAMQALTDIALQDSNYIDIVRNSVEEFTVTGTPAMRSRGKKLLKILNALPN